MIASVVAYLSYQDALRSQLKSDQFYSPDIVKPMFYYAAYAVQLTMLMSAGLVAWFTMDSRTLQRNYFWRLALLIGAALLMTLRGFSFSDLLSTKIVDMSGPFPFILAILVFVGARRGNWRFLNTTMMASAVLFSVLVLMGMTGLQTFSRQEGVASLTGFLNVLFWPASWIALREYAPDSVARHFRFVPIAIYSLGTLFTQTRLNVVMVIALLAVYSIVQYKRKAPQGITWIVGIALAVWMILFTAIFLKDSGAFQNAQIAATAFSERIDQDSRTGQIRRFFEDVQPQELLLGRGSLATWYWPGIDLQWRGGTDIGYLTLLFYGGVPLLLAYFAAILAPGIAIFAKRPATWQLPAAGIVVLWAIRMFSSSYPGMSLESYPVLFCVGACLSRESFIVPSRMPYPIGHSSTGGL
jgi:hypothetical protein